MLSKTQTKILMIVVQGRHHPSDICRIIGIDRSNYQKRISYLEKIGFVRRERGTPRNVFLVYPTHNAISYIQIGKKIKKLEKQCETLQRRIDVKFNSATIH